MTEQLAAPALPPTRGASRGAVSGVGVVASPAGTSVAGAAVERHQPADLAEILERVLNTGIVIAGEIRIDLLDIELLTIKIRLIVTSLDRAEEIGLDWWKGDAWYSGSVPSDPSVVELVKESATDDDTVPAVSPPASDASAETPQAAKKKSTAKKSTAKKQGAKKSTAKKSTAKKQAAKKSTAKRSTAKKQAAKKSTAKRSTAKKQAAKKSTAKKSAAKKSPAKRTVAQKTAAGRTPAKIRAENTGRASARPIPETDDIVVAEAVVARATRGRS